MTKSNTHIETEKRVPALRFKEFEGEWEKNILGNAAKITSGGTPSRSNSNFWNGNIPWVTTSLIDFNEINDAEEFITEDAVKGSSAKLFPKGTLLMAMYGQGKTRGKVAVLGIDATTNQACAAIIPSKEVDQKYLFQNLAGRYDEIRGLSNEGGQQNLSGGLIKKIPFSLPSLPEQQKIAAFLSAVDEKIQQLTQKKDLLAQYKKGVMQQVFAGELRFRDEKGEAYPEWEEKRLGEVIAFTNGKGHEQSIDENGDFVVVNSKFISTAGRVKKYCNTQISPLKKGDIVMVMSDVPNGKALAKCLLIDKDKVYTLNQRICRLQEKLSVNEFLIYIINRNRYYLRFDSGVGQTNLKKDEVLNCPLYIPSSLEEQQKIATFLSQIDTKIEAVTKQIEQSQAFKKGLLQQLFV